MKYDYLVVGAGISGATFARLATDNGKRVKVIEKRPYAGGNCYTEERDGVHIHKHGPHIFHTSNEDVIWFVKRFAEWKVYRHKAVAVGSDLRTYSMPFNMATFCQAYHISLPDVDKVKRFLAYDGRGSIPTPKNLEEEAINLVGSHVYELLIKNYTECQWGKPCEELPTGIISRLPVRFTFDDNYFFDEFQAVPVGGYTAFVEKMLEGVEVEYGTELDPSYHTADKVIFTGMIDELCGYQFGLLPYRSLEFNDWHDKDDYGIAQLNICAKKSNITRITTHKYLGQSHDLPNFSTAESPIAYEKSRTPYYPINNRENVELWQKYSDLTKKVFPNILLLGRLAEYRYYDMDKAIARAMHLAKKELKNG